MEITVRCPSGRAPDVSVQCQAGWRVSELKQHLAIVYPGQPAADTQRIVYAGRLLGNEEALQAALGANATQVVHLVLPGSSAVRSASAPVMSEPPHHHHQQNQQPPQSSSSSSSDELSILWLEYTQYVHAHFLLGGSTSGSSDVPTMQPPPPQQPPPQQPIAPEVDEAGGGGELGADGGIADGGGVGGGLRAWFHTAVRCALMSLIIFYYSSPGKALSAFAIFFAMQAVQGGFLHRLMRVAGGGGAAAAAAQPPAPPPPPAAQQVAEAAAAAVPSAAADPQPPRPAGSFTATLAAFLDALLTTLVAFFTSLIPDRPPPLANQ